jgi:ketosteroid isomerase-like protein
MIDLGATEAPPRRENARVSSDVEVVDRVFAAWRERDLDAMLELISADVVWRPASRPTPDAAYHGHAGVLEWTGQFNRAREPDVRVSEIREGPRGVVVLGTVLERSHGRPVFGLAVGWLCEVRDGKVARATGYVGWQEALEAAGLSD